MVKQIGDLTLREVYDICQKHKDNCNHCPLEDYECSFENMDDCGFNLNINIEEE